VRLWSLQAAIIAALLLVGWAAANAPQIRSAPKRLQEMCAAPGQDDLAKGACAEFNAG
jgi:hypothetical protein